MVRGRRNEVLESRAAKLGMGERGRLLGKR